MDLDEQKSDEQQIREQAAEWRRAAQENDLDTILALMTEDAVFLTPGNPPMKSEEFAAGFRALAGNVRLEIEQTFKEIAISGDLAYTWSYLVVVMTSIATGSRTRRSGDVLTIFRKSPTGAWLLSRDANLLPPMAERKSASSHTDKVEIEFEPAPELAEAVLSTSRLDRIARSSQSLRPASHEHSGLRPVSNRRQRFESTVSARGGAFVPPWVIQGPPPPTPFSQPF